MKKEIMGLFGLSLALYFLIAIIFFSPLRYPALSNYSEIRHLSLKNLTNAIGYFFHIYFGWASLILPLVILFWIFLFYFSEEGISKIKLKFLGLLLLLFSLSGYFMFLSSGNKKIAFKLAGLTGFYAGELVQKYFGKPGAGILFPFLILLSGIIVTELPLFSYTFIILKKNFLMLKKIIFAFLGYLSSYEKARVKVKEVSRDLRPKEGKRSILKEKVIKEEPPQKIPEVSKSKEKIISAGREKKTEIIKLKSKQGYVLPPIHLLREPPLEKEERVREDLRENANTLEETLRDFGIEVKVVNIERGPVITRYELQPAPGVKVQWIASLAEDIGLVMKSYNVHVSPIPGKGTVGVEVPNTTIAVVYLREIISSPEFQNHPSLLSLALGKKVSGEPLVSDLTQMPHLLIAGTTGSGKTVCINALLTSLLYRATPDELRLILIDPKMVELAPFNGLPHLVVPVITEPNTAVAVLEWAVEEMESRYQIFAKAGTRNIETYNNSKKDRMDNLPKSLPYVIIVIDELADLMLVASKEIEGCIARLAQLSRAVGIHMILATQRPSVDVITGVIKANFPSRISFKVASKVDSRTVLDMNGADKLLGKGDMLFIPPGSSKPVRAQGSLISDEEIEEIVKFIKEQRQPSYDESLLEIGVKGKGLKSPGKRDRLYQEAVNVVMQTGQASVSILQRRLGVGYTRAARLIDMMEEDGIVGPYQGSKPREILIDREEYLRGMDNSEPKGKNA